MKKSVIFVLSSIITLIVFLFVWLLSCFLLGYISSNSNHNFEIWVLYAITVMLHFGVMSFIYKNWFVKLSFKWYLSISIIVYVLIAFVLNNY